RFLPFLLVVPNLSCGAEQGKPVPKGALRTETVKRGTVAGTFKATGTLEPEEVVDVGAQVAGQIVAFGTDPADKAKTVDYNTQVEAGTVLARIDPAPYEAQVEKAKAGLTRAQAELKLAEAHWAKADRDFRRAAKLYERKAIGAEEYEDAQTRLDVS